tara:strand:+ start:107 stop:493 length:387 start_codon:yes stop_codon:yes gene_type:complete
MTKYLAKIENDNVVDVTRFSDEDYNLGIDHCKNLISDADSNYILCEKGISINYNYDSNSNTFYRPQPYASWTLDVNFIWQPPIIKPDKGPNGTLLWNESQTRWEGITNSDSLEPSTYWDPSTSSWVNI